MGSTAVPGLRAKPVIDIGLATLAEADRCVRAHHLHVVERSSSFWTDQLLFRDALREDRELAGAYARLKEELAVRFVTDRVGYALAKTDFVEAALRKAR